MGTKKMSEMATDSSIAGTERLLAQGSDGSVILVSAISAYVIDDLIDSTAATPTTGDYLLGFRGTDEKKMTLDNVAAYTVTYAWSAATTATPALTGDLLLVNRGGFIYDMDVDTLQTYCLVGIQASVLNLTALNAATLGATDLFPVCQVGSPTVPKKVALSALETQLWEDLQTYVAALTAVGTSAAADSYFVIQGGNSKVVTNAEIAVYMSAEIISIGDVQTSSLDALAAYLTAKSETTTAAAADMVYVLQSGTAYKMSMATIANYAMDATFELPWKLIEGSKYKALPATTSTLTMSDTSDISIGDPIKFVWSGLTYYAIVTAVSATEITIAGAPFSEAISLSALYVGTPTQILTRTYWISDLFGDSVYDILSTDGRYERWEGPPAYLVSFSATCGTADTGAEQPKINVRINDLPVSSDDADRGIQLSDTPGDWVTNSAVAIYTNNYALEKEYSIEFRCTEAGTNGDAADLSITLVFVYE